jgi:teichoic acid transport system permease protein
MTRRPPDAAPAQENEFTTTHHVYLPHKAGLPPLRTYIKELWRRREFATEMSRANLRSDNTLTVFGQLWLVLNPLFLAGVYFLLVQVLSGQDYGMDFFARLTAGLFTFYFVSGSMQAGAGSVVGGGRLLLNTSFPRLLMPFSAVRTAFFRFLPTLPVYFVFHILAGNPFTVQTLAAVAFLGMLVVFSLGLGALFATIQVYFRDATSFLPYITRIWLYASPVLWTLDQLPERAQTLAQLNPLFSLIGGYGMALTEGQMPPASIWLAALAWALAAFVIGTTYFMSREREFAVRI